MNKHLATVIACFALGLATCAQAASRPARQDRDKDKDNDAHKAQKVKIIHGPVVEAARATDATIAWSTNVKASTILKYGADPGHLNQTAEARWGAVTHRVQLHHLKPGTTYYYRVESTQALGTGSQALSPVEKFRTQGATAAAAAPEAKAAAVKLTHGPVLEGVHPRSATIAWSTNVSAGTLLKYGTNAHDLNQTAEARWGGLTHRVQLRNLKPGTTYYYQVQSTQAQGSGTQAKSAVEHFRTPGTTAAAAR
jgi:phosphodiesterase/alkaline phosphatase D-like protein